MKRVLITTPIETRKDFYEALGGMYKTGGSPTPKNLDGLADFIREFHIKRIICSDWQLEGKDEEGLLEVLKDLGVKLNR